MPLALGLDGGGSHTRCLLANERGEVLGRGLAGASKFDDVGLDRARANVAEAVRQACPTPERVDAAFFGLGGVVSESDRAVTRELLASAGVPSSARVAVDHDCRVALAGGLLGQPGMVLIAGTGSSCYGRDALGRSWRSGGWGFLIDDAGSAFQLGRDALAAVVRAEDGRGPDTALRQPLLQALGVSAVEELMHRLYHPRLALAGVAALAPLVAALAESDGMAAEIVERGCDGLAEMVCAAADCLGFGGTFPLVLAGSVIAPGTATRRRLTAILASAAPAAQPQHPLASPSAGAVLLALAELSVALNAAALARLSATCRLDGGDTLTSPLPQAGEE